MHVRSILRPAVLAAFSLAFLASAPAASASPKHHHAAQQAGQRVELSVTDQGFVPAQVHVQAGKPVTLVVTRTTDGTCARDIVVKDQGIKKALPLNQPVEITFTPKKAGSIRYACAMDMVTGEIVVE